jgi:hypothetical protein
MRKTALTILTIVLFMNLSAVFDEYLKSNEDGFKTVQYEYEGEKITDKTLLIQSIQNECFDLKCKEGLNDNVRSTKYKKLFLELMSKQLTKGIKKHSSFKKVKFESEQDSVEYDFTITLKNFVTTDILNNTANKPKMFEQKSYDITQNKKDVKTGVKIHCTYEIIDNSNGKKVVTGTIGGFGELDCENLKTTKKKKEKDRDYFNSMRITYKDWKSSVSTLGKKIMKDTPFYEKAKKKKKKKQKETHFDFDKF